MVAPVPPLPATPDEADDRLVSAILGSAELALFENAYAAYAEEARRTALAFLGDVQLAADAVHNAYLEVLRYLVRGGRWSEPAEARTVVLRNTRWAALKLLRGRRRRPEQDLDPAIAVADDTSTWARWEARAVCGQIVAKLSPQQQRTLRLRFIEGLSNPAAARRLGLTTSGYASQLRRAIRAARRAARDTGMLPGLACVVAYAAAKTATAVHRAARAARPVPALVARAATLTAIMVVAVQGIGSAVNQVPREGAAARTVSDALPATGAASVQPGAASETVADLVISDATDVPTRADSSLVLAVGWGKRCRCWVVAQSPDAGGHWAVAGGPDVLTPDDSLAVAVMRPADPRIVIVDPRRPPGPTSWVSSAFGRAFERWPGGIALLETVHPSPCSDGPSGVVCLGRRIAAPAGTRRGGALAVADHLLYFPASGGILCSVNAGQTWRIACASA